MPEPVLEAAAESEARWRQGSPLGPLDGVPATDQGQYLAEGLSDTTRLEDQRPRPGSRGLAGGSAAARAGRHFRRQDLFAGAWLDRRLPLAAHRHHPQSVESGETPGGSTGGGAVAALLGLGLLHLGTDGAGSLRIPAAFTGVFGMKPSYGQVPTYPPSALNVLAHQGPVTRRVADAALMLSVISGPMRAT